jgi:hypothetical protein
VALPQEVQGALLPMRVPQMALSVLRAALLAPGSTSLGAANLVSAVTPGGEK